MTNAVGERPAAGAPGSERSLALRIARIHVRTGALALARAELETAAGAGALDLAGLLDLAEVRWRTGDLAGAGDAAGAFLASSEGETDVLACVIAAEAAAAIGRLDEAKRLADRAVQGATIPLDAVFAGLPRRGPWPQEGAATSPQPGSRGDGERATSQGTAGARSSEDRPAVVPSTAADAGGQLDAARLALGRGDASGAALHLGLVLRLSPALAPAVLDVLPETADPELLLVRGDALRLVGREWEARRAFVSAAAGIQPAAHPGDGTAAGTRSSGGDEGTPAAPSTEPALHPGSARPAPPEPSA